MKLASLPRINSELHDIIEAFVFDQDRDDYSTDEYQEAYEDVIVEEVPEFSNCYHIYSEAAPHDFNDYVKIAKSENQYLIMIIETVADECVVIMDKDLHITEVIYPHTKI